MLACSYSSVCSGCDWLLKPADESRDLKIRDFLKKTDFDAEFPVEWIDVASSGLRDRVDLMIDRRQGGHRLGLFDRFQTGIVDLQGCPQLSPALESWLCDFRQYELPVMRGSLRLRVSPKGARGVWLDFANLDVKNLLHEAPGSSPLRGLLREAVIEVGQRRKRLIEREDGELKLVDPILDPWFETYVNDGEAHETAVALHCAIGSFTQPGFAANRALVREVTKRVATCRPSVIAEFGSGIGNFTLPLAALAKRVDAYEVDELALAGLSKTLAVAAETGTLKPEIAKRVQIHTGNFQLTRKVPASFADTDLIFVDPPRSGLQKFLDPLFEISEEQRPPWVVYLSCFTESFATDSARLKSLGYWPESSTIVDQFPQTHHYEVITTFRRRAS